MYLDPLKKDPRWIVQLYNPQFLLTLTLFTWRRLSLSSNRRPQYSNTEPLRFLYWVCKSGIFISPHHLNTNGQMIIDIIRFWWKFLSRKCCTSSLCFVKIQQLSSNEPVHEIFNNVVCATSKASDQPAHTRSLIWGFASRLRILWLLSYWLNTIWSF